MQTLKSAIAVRLAAAATILACAASAASAGGFYNDIPPDLAKAAQAFDDAQLKADGTTLRTLLADDYRLINSGGIIENKAQFIRDYTDPNFKLLPFALQEPVHIVWNGGAVLGAKVNMRWIDHGKPGSKPFRFADIWAKRDGAWRVVYTQVTRLPPG